MSAPVSTSPGLWALFFGYSKDPKTLNQTFKDLKSEVGNIQNEFVELKSICFKEEDDEIDKLYLKSAEHQEFLNRCYQSYFPSYKKIVKLKTKLESLLITPINYDSKANIAKQYPKLCQKINAVQSDFAMILKLYNTDLKFEPYNHRFRAFCYNILVRPPIACFNFANSITGSKINTFAILLFSIWAPIDYKYNGLVETALHTAAFMVLYTAKNWISNWINSYS